MKQALTNKITVAKAEIGSKIWATPVIPPKPKRVVNVKNPVISLNETSKDGTWKFLFESPQEIPLPTAEHQDFDFSLWKNKDWHSVIVPGGLVMQGFDIGNNKEYYYQRTVTIPSDYKSSHRIIRFYGAYTNVRVWINGTYIRTHIGGFSVWDCDISDHASAGDTVTLTVGIADTFGSEEGIWNTGGTTTDPSRASYYAHHNVGGINRDVELLALPKNHIVRMYSNTIFDEKYTDANLEVTVQIGAAAKTTVIAEVLDRKHGQVIGAGEMEIPPGEEGNASAAYKMSIPVASPEKWDAEHPNLYILRTSLLLDGEIQQINEENLGFREISYGGNHGTEPNRLYVNGKEIKLRATCRHDVSYTLGRSTTREQDFEEILAYKHNNINSIRTSHYPGSEHLLDACDEIGIYVEQEPAVCFQGVWGNTVYASDSDFVNQFAEMVEYNRNRPSIIIWSLGNESDFKTTNAFQLEYDYIKEVDLTRPVIFSFPKTTETKPYDIYSAHYAAYDEELGSPEIPVYHDEYAHISCYNLDELQRDVNVRNFWGESIKLFWEKIFVTAGALGGALWGGIDDIFYLPEGTCERWQNHSGGPAAGYGEWGSVLDVYLRDKPEAYLTKKAYSPIRVDVQGATVRGSILSVPVKNWFDHTDFSELTLSYAVDGSRWKHMPSPLALAPHQEGILMVEDDWANADTVAIRFFTEDGISVEENSITLHKKSYVPSLSSATGPTITEDEDAIVVSSNDKNFSISFDKATGMIREARYRKDTLLVGGPYLHVTGTYLGEWVPAAAQPVQAAIEGNKAVVIIQGSYGNGTTVKFDVSISENGIITTKYTVLSSPAFTGMTEVGLRFTIPETVDSVHWLREGLYSVYPEDHIGRNHGTALRVRPEGQDKFGVKPSWPWKDDMKNFFLYPHNDKNDGIATNDFKTMRENIYHYTVGFAGIDSQIIVEDETAQVAARVDLTNNMGYIDDRDSQVVYHGAWEKKDFYLDFNGTKSVSTELGASCKVTFEGTGIRFIGSRQNDVGMVKIYIDDVLQADTDTFSDLGHDLKQQEIFKAEGLARGEHTLTLVTSGGKYNSFVVDAFEILGGNADSGQESGLIVNKQWYYPNLGWGNYFGQSGTLTKGTSGTVTLALVSKEK